MFVNTREACTFVKSRSDQQGKAGEDGWNTDDQTGKCRGTSKVFRVHARSGDDNKEVGLRCLVSGKSWSIERAEPAWSRTFPKITTNNELLLGSLNSSAEDSEASSSTSCTLAVVVAVAEGSLVKLPCIERATSLTWLSLEFARSTCWPSWRM